MARPCQADTLPPCEHLVDDRRKFCEACAGRRQDAARRKHARKARRRKRHAEIVANEKEIGLAPVEPMPGPDDGPPAPLRVPSRPLSASSPGLDWDAIPGRLGPEPERTLFEWSEVRPPAGRERWTHVDPPPLERVHSIIKLPKHLEEHPEPPAADPEKWTPYESPTDRAREDEYRSSRVEYKGRYIYHRREYEALPGRYREPRRRESDAVSSSDLTPSMGSRLRTRAAISPAGEPIETPVEIDFGDDAAELRRAA